MSYNRALTQKTINYVLYSLLFFSIFSSVSAQSPESLSELFINNLRNYFSAYYSRIKEEGIIKPQEQVLKDIQEIVFKYSKIDKQALNNRSNFDDLSILIDDNLRGQSKSINIFTVSGSSIVNCWLGDLVEEKKKSKNIWGKQIEFTIKVMDNLEIKDFSYFLSEGKEALDVGTRDNIIYYNLEAYKIRANFIWDFFADRETEKKNKRYDPSKSNRLRKWLYHKTWSSLYSGCIKDNRNLEETKTKFIDKAIIILRENTLFHEVGHIFANRYLKLNDEIKEEIAAFLTELNYGNLPYESLETVIAASYKSSIGSYNLAGREIMSAFIFYIENEQKRKNPEYREINIQGRNQIEKMDNLYKLTEKQIRSIGEYIYKQKIEEGRNHG